MLGKRKQCQATRDTLMNYQPRTLPKDGCTVCRRLHWELWIWMGIDEYEKKISSITFRNEREFAAAGHGGAHLKRCCP